MGFEFGMFHEFQRPAGMSDEQAFATSFEQVDAAERWGLDAMWLAEIHIAPERSVLSAPLTLASAIAARTKRMKIGTAVQVLPLCHPLRLAEEVATVDQISHGRLIFGVGRSGFPRTYEAYGVPYGESRERFAETLEILKRAWTEPRFSYQGKYYSFDNVALTPKPYQKPWPEIRVAANSADTFPAIAKLGHAVFVAVRLGTLEELEPNITAYRKAWKEAGHPGEGKVFLRAPVYRRRHRRGGAARSRKKASCISTAISASGLKIRRPAPGCGPSRTAPRAAAACRRSPTRTRCARRSSSARPSASPTG